MKTSYRPSKHAHSPARLAWREATSIPGSERKLRGAGHREAVGTRSANNVAIVLEVPPLLVVACANCTFLLGCTGQVLAARDTLEGHRVRVIIVLDRPFIVVAAFVCVAHDNTGGLAALLVG
jgi:hypothetical protein